MKNLLILAMMLLTYNFISAQTLSGPNGKWDWDGRYLKNYNNSSIKWEWDGRYLKNYNNSSQKYELPSGAPVPVWAVVYGIIN